MPSTIRKTEITAQDNASIDAFGRWRVSQPKTIFDSKMIFDDSPLFWDDQETTGSGTSSTHSTDKAEVDMAVSLNTAGTRVRQTFQRFNYQPGKSQQILMTGVLGAGASGITRRVGYFDGDNGIFFELSGTTLSAVTRSKTSGSVVDDSVAQANWNVDKLDGTGDSGVTIDTSKTQIFVIDFEWLGVGRVRLGVVVSGVIIYCHTFLNANVNTAVYMSTPNLPLRYEISNDGAGAASSLKQICSTVMSEGGQETLGVTRVLSTEGTHVDANAANTIYAIIGYRLKSTHLDAAVLNKAVSVISETNDDFEWSLWVNPTVAGTFTYSDLANSSVQVAKGTTANTVTGGFSVAGSFSKQDLSVSELLNTPIKVGSAIDGTVDEMVLCVRPLSANADIQATLTIKELI